MNEVFLTPTKSLVRKQVINKYTLENPQTDLKGMLTGFEITTNTASGSETIKYIFIDKNKYWKRDQDNTNTIVTGFVKYDAYVNYINDSQGVYNYRYIIDPVNWFDVNLEWAQVGDLFTIKKLETRPDKTNNFTKYFIYYECEFIISDLSIDFANSDQYPPEQPNKTLPGYCKINSQDKSGSLASANAIDYRFFQKNFGSKVNSLTLDPASKEILYIGIVKICWRITNILKGISGDKDVLSKVAIKDLDDLIDIAKHAQPPSGSGIDIRTHIINGGIPGLSHIDRAITVLLIDWGYRSYDETLEMFSTDTTDQLYGGYYEPFENYYNTLVNLYINITYTEEKDLFGVTTNPSTWSPEFTDKQSDLRLEKLISIIPEGAVNFLSLETKIKILKTFAENPIYESREDAVVKIVKSIKANDSTTFLLRLQSETYLENGKVITLFEKLYEKINDRIIFFGKNNRKDFINNLYFHWYRSTLNPYKALALGLQNQNPNTSAVYFENFHKNKPIILNYDSTRTFKFFVDNMNFKFNGKNISVEEEVVTGYSATVGGGEVHEQKEYRHKGDYDLYAGMSLQHFKPNDIAVTLPSIALQPDGTEDSYIFPIFYVKYIDDVGDGEDLITAGEATLDIALTFTGIGNLSKLRHLRHLSLLGRIAMGGAITGTERILFMRALSGAASFVQLTSGVAKSIWDYYSNGCQVYINEVEANINDSNPQGQIPANTNNYIPNYDRCKAIDNVLFWAQAVSTGGGSLAEDMLREAAMELTLIGLPADFPPSAATFIISISQLEADLTNFLNSISTTFPNVKSNVSNFTIQKDKYAFMLDFKNKNAELTSLNTEPNLINIWLNISPSVHQFRKSINFLKARRFIGLPMHDHFVKHVFEGEVHPTTFRVGGFHYVPGVANTISAFGKIKRTLQVDRGYKICHVEVFDANGNSRPKYIGNTTNYVPNDMFRQDWTKTETLDNLALAYTTKIYTPNPNPSSNPGNKYIGVMSDGRSAIICIDGGQHNANVDYVNKLKTSWPQS